MCDIKTLRISMICIPIFKKNYGKQFGVEGGSLTVCYCHFFQLVENTKQL